MAGEPLSDQPQATAPGNEADFYYVVQSGQTRQQSRSQLRAAILTGWQAFMGTFLASADQATARSNIGAAESGANASITSLTGLTTPLSVSRGGTGVATLAAYLASLLTVGAYAKTNILGTVSQSAGVPTGAIIESGGTVSGTGRYIKYADGTMTITKTLVPAGGSTTAAGAIFRCAATAGGSFPVAFVGDLPIIAVAGTDATGGGWVAMDAYPTLLIWGSYSTRNHVSAAGAGIIHLTATGRWF